MEKFILINRSLQPQHETVSLLRQTRMKGDALKVLMLWEHQTSGIVALYIMMLCSLVGGFHWIG